MKGGIQYTNEIKKKSLNPPAAAAAIHRVLEAPSAHTSIFGRCEGNDALSIAPCPRACAGWFRFPLWLDRALAAEAQEAAGL